LKYIIDTHPDFCSPPELNLGNLCQALHWGVYYTKGEISGAANEEERRRVTLAEVRRITSDLLDSYTAGKKKRRWCEKTPHNLEFLPILSDVYPDAKYLCLYRNCMDFVHSILESCKLGYWDGLLDYVRHSPNNLVNAMAQAWADKTEQLLRFEREHSSNSFRIQYESLVFDPVGTLKPAFEFLEAEWKDDLIRMALRTGHDQGEGDLKVIFTTSIHTESVGTGSRLRRDNIDDKTLEKVNKLLEELGYPIIGPDWGTAPSPYLQGEVRQKETFYDINKIFDEHFLRRLKERASDWQHINAVFKWVVTGDGGGQWTIDLTGKEPRISAEIGEADCTITISRIDLVDMINGILNPGEAVSQGRVGISGDLQLARAIGPILFRV
jgi:hypothetical protein